MRHTRHEHGCDSGGSGWEHLGHAAEQFARRVGRDAQRFASRLQDHVEELAHDVRREARCHTPRAAWGGGSRQWSPEDVQRVFTEVRTVLRSVIDGVDELIGGVFQGGAAAEWTHIVGNRDETCASCGKTIAAGSEAYVRGSAADRQFRCVDCHRGSASGAS